MKDKSPIVLILCAVVFGSFLVGESYAASEPFHATVAAAMEQANTRLANEFVYGPGLLMDYKGPMPTPESPCPS